MKKKWRQLCQLQREMFALLAMHLSLLCLTGISMHEGTPENIFPTNGILTQSASQVYSTGIWLILRNAGKNKKVHAIFFPFILFIFSLLDQ